MRNQEIDNSLLSFSKIGSEEELKNTVVKICLSDVRYPTTKNILLAHSRIHCPKNVTNSLKGSPKKSFNNIVEVQETVL